MEELECIPLLDGVRKILARSTGGSEDSEFGGVVLRQVPVAQRVVPQEDIRGEVMDFIVQQIEDTDLSPAYVWAIATKVANKISEAIPSNIQINALNDVAKKELDSLCAKIEADPSILEVRSSSSSISVKALRNARRTMEDRHVIISDLNLVAGLEISPHYEYYAVFDGHGGRDAANYCAAHFHLVLAEQLRSGLEVPAAMEKAFKIVDGNFCDRALEMARKAGSTAVVALIVDRKTLHVGWLGDSEAVLARDGQAQALVRPHKPSVISEQERIERLGGEVISMMGVHRVNANLAVSRAVGDVEHKPFVSNDAEVTTVELDDLCDFIVLGCDGLFDLLSHQDVVVNAYHSALTRRFDTSVAENLTRSAISSGSTDNVTTIVVNLRDPKKWHFESVVFPKPEATDRVTPVAGKNLNGSPESAAPNMPLAGGDSSPVREVAAGFVSDTVEMALNRVNGAPPSNLDLACDLSPPEEEQRDLMATLKNDTPEADRLNPDAPEFVPSFPTASTAPELPNQSSSEENTEATVITASSQPDTMPKSESRDELVYEIDRELGTAPQAVQAELVNLDVSSAAGVSPPKAAEALSDSDEDLNSMVVHEDQPQPEIKLSELIVREQHIHVIPEESPSDEISSPMPEANAIPEAAAAPEVTQNGSNVDQLVDLQDDTKSPPPTPVHTAVEDAVDAAPASAAINVEQVVDLVSGLQEQVAEKSVQNLVENPQVSEDLVDLASQVLQGDVLEQIEHSDPCKPACKSPVSEAPVKVEDSQYLFSADVGVHEEAIVPRAQPLLFDGEESSADNALVDAIDNLILDEAPKVVDAIEKPSEPKTVDEAAVQVAEFVADTKIEDTLDFSTGSIELDSVKDVVEKLSAANESREETVAAPIIPDSIPQAEGVQDVDSESDNDAQEWSFVKPVEQQQQPPPSESQEAVSATAAAAAVVAATSVAAAVVATTAEPTPSATPAATPKATEKPKAPARAAKSASASKPSPAKTPTSAASAKTAAVKASPKTTTPLKPAAKPQSASPAPSKPTPARVSATAAKTSAATKPPAPKAPAPKPAPARPAGTTKAAAPAPPKPSSTATSKAPAAPRPAVSKPAPAKPVTSTTAKTTAAASTRPAVSARAPATSAASKPVASRPASTKPPAPKAPTKPATTASATATNKASSVATTKTTASTARPTAPKPAVSSTGVKKTTTTNSTATGAASSASRVAAARVAAARTAVKTTQPTPAATSSSAKPKTGAAKTASSTAAGKVAPKSPVKKAVKQEKKAPAAAPEEAPKENGSANAVSQTNGHASPHVENGSSDPSGPVPAEAPAVPSSEGQGDILV